jgi:hypothetical protein
MNLYDFIGAPPIEKGLACERGRLRHRSSPWFEHLANRRIRAWLMIDGNE